MCRPAAVSSTPLVVLGGEGAAGDELAECGGGGEQGGVALVVRRALDPRALQPHRGVHVPRPAAGADLDRPGRRRR